MVSEKYLEMVKVVGRNQEEQGILSKLQKGCTPLQCMQESGLSQKEFSDLLERAKKWEIENMCIALISEER